MGKQKRQRRKSHKANPTGLPSVKEFTESEEIPKSREKALQNIYDEVQSFNFEEKLSALQTLESIACDTPMAVQIARDRIAKLVGPLLFHCNPVLRGQTASTLVCIADNSEGEAYSLFVKDDIMTPLAAALKQYYSEWQPPNDCKDKVRSEKETFIQMINLLLTLSENCEIVIKCINDEDLVSILIRYLNVDMYGIEIVTVIIQCLVSITENNDAAIQKIQQEKELLKSMLTDMKANDDISESEVMYLKIVICTLWLNIKKPNENIDTKIFSNMCSVLSEVLTMEHKQLLSNLISDIPHESSISSQGKKRIQQNRRMLGAQRQALEILTNICFEEEDNEMNSDSDDEMENDISIIDIDFMDDEIMDDNLMSTCSIELLELINHYNLMDKIWDKTTMVDISSREILNQTAEGVAVLAQFEAIQNRAYFCLNNLLCNLEIETFGGVDFLYNKWLEIGKTIFENVNVKNLEYLEAATATMRSIIHRLAEVSRDQVNVFCDQLTIDDIHKITSITQKYSEIKIRVNIIRMLGSIVLIILNNQNPAILEIVKYVSTFLLDFCLMENEAYVIAETLDAIMDMYAADKTNYLAAEIHLVSRLQSVIPVFKTKTRQQRKRLGDTAVIISTVNINLPRFIKYKEKQLKR